MKTLRFRAVELPTIIECGFSQSINGGWRFPVHLRLDSLGGSYTINITNNNNNPIKLKVFINGVLYSQTSYFGDPFTQDVLDAILTDMFMPLETVDGNFTQTITFPASAGDVVDMKIYCPFASSSFQFNLTC